MWMNDEAKKNNEAARLWISGIEAFKSNNRLGEVVNRRLLALIHPSL